MQDSECLTVSLPSVAKALGISRGLCYQLARRDELPVKVLHLGKRMVVSKQSVLRLLQEDMQVRTEDN